MDRRTFLRHASLFAAGSALLGGCTRSHSQPSAEGAASDSTRYVSPVSLDRLDVAHSLDAAVTPVDTPRSTWEERLSAERFHILFEAGTERAGTSPLLDEKRRGTFVCSACHLPLFPSTTKYESGTGWPSFWAPLPGRVDTERDTKLGYARTEYHCQRCGGHQGHIFSDGPDPTGLRYCNNGLALRFVPESTSLPSLRT